MMPEKHQQPRQAAHHIVEICLLLLIWAAIATLWPVEFCWQRTIASTPQSIVCDCRVIALYRGGLLVGDRTRYIYIPTSAQRSNLTGDDGLSVGRARLPLPRTRLDAFRQFDWSGTRMSLRRAGRGETTGSGTAFPFWLLVLVSACSYALYRSARSLWATRRHHRGLCPACGYGMRATPHRCPECGSPPHKHVK